MSTTDQCIQYNLNLDDLLPRYTDFSVLYKVLRVVPDIKVTVFMPISSRDWGQGKNYILDHPYWCRKVASLPSKNFEFSCHGWEHHLRDKTPEFKCLSQADATVLLEQCERAFARAGIPFVKGFRPPCWEMSEGTERALENLGYLYLSDSPRFYEEHKDIKIPRIFSNDDIGQGRTYAEVKPFVGSGILPDPGRYCIQRGHLVSDLRNNLTAINLQRVINTVRSLRSVEFKFLSEIAQEWD